MSSKEYNKQKARPFEFQPQAEKIKSYEYPKKEPNKIILRVNESGIGFRKEFEDTNITRYVSEDILAKTLEKINTLCNRVYQRSRTEETKNYNVGQSKLLNISAIQLLASFICIWVSITCGDEKQNDYIWLFWIATFIALGGGFILLIVLFLVLANKQKFTNYNEDLRKEVKILLNTENIEKFKQYNVKWNISEDLFWVSIERIHFDCEYDK